MVYYFLAFVLGFVVSVYLTPILDSLGALILTTLEIPKGLSTLKVAKINSKINKFSEDDKPIQHQIGFVVDTEEEENLELEDDD